MLRACPHHGFMELTQIDTFYNGLNDNDQDSLNVAAGGNLLSKTTREALNIIENKSKLRYSRNKSNVSRMNTTYRESFSKTDERIDKLADQISTLVKIVSKKVVTPATVKANLLNEKEKLFELAKINRLNEEFRDARLKKLPEKLKIPTSFLVPCDFTGNGKNGEERNNFHVDKHPQKHANESIKMINFIDVSCEDSFGEVLRLKKSNHFSSGSTTSLSDSRPSLTSFETSDSLLEEFTDELALLDPFPPGNEDVDVEVDLREIELLLNQDPSTDFSPKITFDPNLERFTNEPALVCLPPPGDDESFLKKDIQEDECFDPRGDIDEINAFLDDYKDSGEDVLTAFSMLVIEFYSSTLV
ncbi:hypothetical protein Tco_1237335 [Tanacetum coccineum]